MADHITAGVPDDVHHCALAKALTGVLMGDARFPGLDVRTVTVKVDDSGRSGHQLVVWAAWDWIEATGDGERRRHTDAEIEPREAAAWWACLNDTDQRRTRKLADAHPGDGEWFTALDIHSRFVDTRTKEERRLAEGERRPAEVAAEAAAVTGEPPHEHEVKFTATYDPDRRRAAPRKPRRTSRRFGVR
jgi:hypothetical protein